MKNMIIELKVRNHTDTMQHVAGLFSRKEIFPDAVYFKHDKNTGSGRIFLVINRKFNKELMLKQLKRLYDITEISVHDKLMDYIKNRIYLV